LYNCETCENKWCEYYISKEWHNSPVGGRHSDAWFFTAKYGCASHSFIQSDMNNKVLDKIDNYISNLQLKWGKLSNVIFNEIHSYIYIIKCKFVPYGSNYACLSCEVKDYCLKFYKELRNKQMYE
jgi:hypothetical protein